MRFTLDLLGQKRDVKTSGFVYVDKCQLTLRRLSKFFSLPVM